MEMQVGRYQLLERIGRGRLGAVYRGRDTLLDREVAVKLMSGDFTDDAAARTRFFREAKAAARLQHKNIVTIFEFGEHEHQTPYVVMELLRGSSLAEAIAQRVPMTMEAKIDTIVQLCSGLEFAHDHGLIHRDIRPQNVWLCSEGTVKLLDFGIASAGTAETTHSGAGTVGSISYLSPEQVASAPADRRSDIFSVGVILYELVAGRRPFDGTSPTGTMLNIVGEAPHPIENRDELPDGLQTVLNRVLSKEPGTRYQRAAALGADLNRIQIAIAPAPDDTQFTFDRATGRLPAVQDPVPEAPPPVRRFPFTNVPLTDRRILWLVVALAGALVLAVVAASLWLTGARGSGARGPVSGTSTSPPQATPPISPPPQPAPEPPAEVHLNVTSDPPGATISVDGREETGTTPSSLTIDPARRPQRIRLAKPGFVPYEADVTDDTISSGTMNVALTPLPTARAGPAFLSVSIDTARFKGCSVLVAGRYFDHPPFLKRPIAAGRHDILLQCADGATVTRRVDLTAGATHEESFP